MPGGNLAVQIRCALGMFSPRSSNHDQQRRRWYYQICLTSEFCQYLLHESDSQSAKLTGHTRVGASLSDSMRPTTTYQQVNSVSFRQCGVPGSALCAYRCRVPRRRSGPPPLQTLRRTRYN